MADESPKYLPEATEMTGPEQAEKMRWELKRQLLSMRKGLTNTARRKEKLLTDLGISVPPSIRAEADLHDLKLDLQHGGMEEEEVDGIISKAKGAASSTVGWILDKALRFSYATGAVTKEVFDDIAPPGTETRSAIHRMFRDAVDTFNETGDKKMTAAMMLTRASDPAISGTLFQEVSNLARIIEAKPEAAPLVAYSGVKKVYDWFRDPTPNDERDNVFERVKMLSHMTAPTVARYNNVIANELFSGIGPLEGEKHGLMEVVPEVTGMQGEEVPTIADALAKDYARLTGRNPAEYNALDIGFQVDGTDEIVEFRYPDGTVKTGRIPTNIRTLPGTNIPFQWVGPRIGFTEDGAGILSFKRNGLLDPNMQSVNTLAAEMVLDPTTYVTGGATSRALGRPLSEKGQKFLVAKIDELAKKDALVVTQVAQTQGQEAAEALVKELQRRPVSVRAEQILIDKAQRDFSLLAPKGEVRFMGVPVAAFGSQPGKTSLARQLSQQMELEKLWRKFDASMMKNFPRLSQVSKDTLAKVHGIARSVQDTFSPSLTSQEEFLAARSAAAGVSMMQQAAFDNRLSVLKLTDDEIAEVMQRIGEPLSQAVPSTQNVATMINMVDELDARYAALNQEVMKGVQIPTANIWIDTLEATGHDTMANILRNRIAKITQANPQAKNLPRTEVFFLNDERLVQEYTRRLADEFSGFRHEQVKKMVEQVTNMSVHPKHMQNEHPATKRLLGMLYDAKEKGGIKAMDKVADRITKAIDDKGQMLLGKGDNGAMITPLSRDELLSLLGDVQRRSGLKKLTPVSNPKQHLLLRAQVANSKEAFQFLMQRTYQLLRNDKFGRRVLERQLVPIGVLENHPNASMQRVQDAWNGYRQGRAAGYNPMTHALSSLKTKEDIQLFVRQWLVDPEQKEWAKGSFGQRVHQFFLAMNDNAQRPGGMLGFEVAPGQGRKARLQEFTHEQFANEARELRQLLDARGMVISDVLPANSLSGEVLADGTRFVPFRRLKKDGKVVRLLGNDTGDVMYVPQSVQRELHRISEQQMARNKDLQTAVKLWDGYTNFVKMGLTSLYGIPSFQVRNLYGNSAFMLYGTHIHGLRTFNKLPQMAKMAFLNSDPNLAVTASGYVGSLRSATLNYMVTTPRETLTLGEAKRMVREMYMGGANSRLPGRKYAAKLVDDDAKLTKEAKMMMDQLDEVVITTDFGTTYTRRELMEQFKRQGVDIDGKVLAEFTGEAERYVSKRGGLGLRDFLAPRAGAARDKIMRLNTFFEQWSRQQMFITELARGKSPEEAGRLVNKWLLDYRAASPREQAIFKRAIPFYQFYRRALPVMIEAQFTRPGITAAYGKILRDPHEPQFSYRMDDGTIIQLHDDGENFSAIGNVELPMVAVLSMLDAINPWVGEDVKKEGKKKLYGMLHPAMHGLTDIMTNFEFFRGKITDKKKMNSLGEALDRAFDGKYDGTLYRTTTNPYTGDIDYEFDKGLVTGMFQMLGLSRLVSNGNRIADAMDDLSDDEYKDLLRFVSGLELRKFNGERRKAEQLNRVIKKLKEVGVHRGILDEYTKTILLDPGINAEREAGARRDRQYKGIPE